MIKINLLPREERKRRAPVRGAVILAWFGVVLVLLGMGYGWYWMNGVLGNLRAQIQETQTQLKRFEELAKQVDRFREDKKRLEEKINIIDKLVAAQRGPVHLLDEVSKALPNEVWLTALTQTGKRVDLSGIAFSNFAVANLMTNLAKADTLISNVDLVVSEKTLVQQVPVERFTITLGVKEKG
jgi:type IV pilus assembly protein PilN